MSKIGGKNTTAEILRRKALFANGFRYRLHNKNLPGSPDIVLKKYCAVIFVNGCFWHGHANCINYRPAKNNIEFWKTKAENTKRRDSLNAEKLRDLNWNVFTVWECELKKDVFENTLNNLIHDLEHSKEIEKNCSRSKN